MEGMLEEIIQMQKSLEEQEALDREKYLQEEYGMLKGGDAAQNPFSHD